MSTMDARSLPNTRTWQTLGAQVRFWRTRRIAVTLQSLLRSYLAVRRDARVDSALTSLQGLLGLLGNIQLTLGLRRRAAVKIQAMYRMRIAREIYKKFCSLKRTQLAVTKIQATFRGTLVRQQTGPALVKQAMLKSIRIMQASVRRVLCTKILYWSAIRRQRETAAQQIQTQYRARLFRRKMGVLRAGLVALAVRAKFLAFMLGHAQVRIAKRVRGVAARRLHPYETQRIAVVRKQGVEKRRLDKAATRIRNYWKMWIVRRQFVFVRRLSTALQILLRTSLAQRAYKGPRLRNS